MNVSRRIVALFFISAFLLGSGVSFFVQLIFHTPGRHLPQVIGLIFVLMFIAIAGKLLHYQQALNRAKQNLDEAQQLAGLGSWERDLATGKGYWSDNHYRLFNLSPRTVAPNMEEFFMMIHEEDRQQARETVMEAICSNGSYEIKYRMDGDAGNRIFLSRGKVRHNDSGEPATLIGTIQDITHKHRRDQFREGLLKQKDLFISRLGHDLKTPLTPLVALLPLIRSRTEESRQQELLDLCINNVNHIKDLVAKTLQLARLTSSDDVASGRFDLQLSVSVDSSVSRLAEIFRNHGIAIEHSIPSDMTVRGNREELEELFTQLFSNAVKFSPPGSRVTVEAACENGFVVVVVRDNGIGLLPEELPHIFDDFYKADHSRHVLGSSGLGLTICRRIVENHGGRISASSPGRDGGTAISFTLEAGGSA
jgi:signal transduction histidine kinase